MKENEKEMTRVITFERNGMNVKVNGIECPISKQATKGDNKEVVNFKKVVGEGWKYNRQLSLIPEGISELTIGAIQETGCKKYVLTKEEQARINELEAEIEAIKENARKRYIPATHKDIHKMSIEELEAYIELKKSQLK